MRLRRLLLLCLVLAGCGQAGPLYLPEDRRDVPDAPAAAAPVEPTPTPAPAAEDGMPPSHATDEAR